jgi:tetratricopeptide (TPR) repeat protein
MLAVVVIFHTTAAAFAAGGVPLSESLPPGSAIADRSTFWQKQIQRDPRKASLHVEYARFLVNAGLVDRAITEFDKARLLDPHDPEPLIALAEIYSQNLDYDKALDFSQRALRLQPSSSMARIVLLTSLVQRDRIDEAERELQKLLASNPHNPRVLQLAYTVKTRIGDLNEAAKYLEEAVRLQPNNIEWVLELCNLLETSGNPNGAYIYLQNLLARYPNSLEARLRLARNLEVYRHDYDRAMNEYGRVLEIDSKSPVALAGVERCKAKKNNLALRLKQMLHGWLYNRVPRASKN